MYLPCNGIRKNSCYFLNFGKGKTWRYWWLNFQNILFHIPVCFKNNNKNPYQYINSPLSIYSSRLMTNPVILRIETKSKKAFIEMLKALWSLTNWHAQTQKAWKSFKWNRHKGYSRHFSLHSWYETCHFFFIVILIERMPC